MKALAENACEALLQLPNISRLCTNFLVCGLGCVGIMKPLFLSCSFTPLEDDAWDLLNSTLSTSLACCSSHTNSL